MKNQEIISLEPEKVKERLILIKPKPLGIFIILIAGIFTGVYLQAYILWFLFGLLVLFIIAMVIEPKRKPRFTNYKDNFTLYFWINYAEVITFIAGIFIGGLL